MDNILGKAEDGLEKFLDDPEKVAQAKAKGRDFLEKKGMDPTQANELLDSAQSLLSEFVSQDEGTESGTGA